jgi:hypothetical protein
MELDRVHADPEAGGNLEIRQAVRDELEHLRLAARERSEDRLFDGGIEHVTIVGSPRGGAYATWDQH